jgi:Luciferase-like monooxygenase
MNVSELKFGLDTFGDMSLDDNGQPVSAGQVIRDVVAQAKLAEEVGLDSFNIGEHHRDDYAVSAPDTILAGIATVTSKIKLGTGVTVLSSDDPVRVYQRFATIDALSSGRAEITAGRGSFIESFPLFGYELANYGDLFEEKLELLVELLKEKPVTWSGRMRASLTNQEVYPKTERGAIPLRVGVGGSPDSVVRAARLGTQHDSPHTQTFTKSSLRSLVTQNCRYRFTHLALLQITTTMPLRPSGHTTKLHSAALAKNVAGAQPPRCTSSPRSMADPCMWVLLRRLQRRLLMQFRVLGLQGLT